MNIDITITLLLLLGASTIGLWVAFFAQYLWSERVDEELEMIHELHKNFDKDLKRLKKDVESDERVNNLWCRVNELTMKVMRNK